MLEFRERLYACMSRRRDALFELTGAVLTAGVTTSPVHLSLVPIYRRGWGSLYAASMADIDALGTQVKESFGEIDALFVNHGYAKVEPFEELTEASYDRQFAVNTKGAFFTVQRLAPLVRDGASIVFTGSVADEGGSPGMIAYAGSKAALWSFDQGFAAELLPRAIRVNAVSPGFIDTPSMGVDAPDEWKAGFSKVGDEVTPMKRHGTPEEVAGAAMFLAFGATFTTAVKVAPKAVWGGASRRRTNRNREGVSTHHPAVE